MRFDVHTVRVHLVNELLDAPQVKEVWHDGSDVVILDFFTGETVSIHLIERFMSVEEITYIFTENARQNLYTVLILWMDMFMPHDGQIYIPDDWMMTLLALFGGKIYAYDAWRGEPFIFNVEFTRLANSVSYVIKHGEPINIAYIHVDSVEIHLSYFRGVWRVGRFEHAPNVWQAHEWAEAETSPIAKSVRYYYHLLGIAPTDDTQAIKRAYRDLARQFHPDRNLERDTTDQMQRINDAYERVLRYLEDTHPPS